MNTNESESLPVEKADYILVSVEQKHVYIMHYIPLLGRELSVWLREDQKNKKKQSVCRRHLFLVSMLMHQTPKYLFLQR